MDKNQLIAAYKRNNDNLRSLFNYYEFLTPEISEKLRIELFAEFSGLDPRTVKKHIAELSLIPKKDIPNGNSDFLKGIIEEHASPSRLWNGLGILCTQCDFKKGKCAPVNGCIYCNSCQHKSICNQRHGTGGLPTDCKLLVEICRLCVEITKQMYIYFPLEYVLPLEDVLVAECLKLNKEHLKYLLGEEIDLDYISCVIRYAHLFNMDNCIPSGQASSIPNIANHVELNSEDITIYHGYYMRSLPISRLFPEDSLQRTLEKIVCNPIDDLQVELWNKCRKFKDELRRAQKTPEHRGSIDELLEYVKKDVSLADIIVFIKYFPDISFVPLRPIDVQVLQKCLCWENYSCMNFLQKLAPYSPYLSERLSAL